MRTLSWPGRSIWGVGRPLTGHRTGKSIASGCDPVREFAMEALLVDLLIFLALVAVGLVVLRLMAPMR